MFHFVRVQHWCKIQYYVYVLALIFAVAMKMLSINHMKYRIYHVRVFEC